MFEIGDVIICIDQKHTNYTTTLTYGKKYYVISTFPGWKGVRIMNDINVFGDYFSERFLSLLEFRKKKLEKICSKLEIK